MATSTTDWSLSCVTERGSMAWPNNAWRAFRKRWLRERLWHIQGEALDAYLTIETAIDNALQAYDVLHEGIKVYNQILAIKPYMVGRHPGNSRPCIFICCRDKASLKRVCEAIEGNHEWQELRTRYPKCFDVHPVLGKHSPVYLGPEAPQESAANEVLYNHALLNTVYGASICFRHSQNWRSSVLGGFVVLGEEIYGLTVAHGVLDLGGEDKPGAEIGRTEVEDLSPADIDILFPSTEQGFSASATNDEPDHRLSFDADSGVSMVSAMSMVSTHDSDDLEYDPAENPNTGHRLNESQLETFGRIQHVQAENDSPADWALIKITSAKYLSYLETQTPENLAYMERILHLRLGPRHKSRVSASSEVFLWIAGIEHTGYIDASSSLVRLPGHQNLIRLLEVTVPSLCFQRGHCGAWVYSRRPQKDGTFILRGHIIAGTPGSSSAYIAPIENIQKSIETQLGLQLRLPLDLVNRHENLSRYRGIPSPPPELPPVEKVFSLLRKRLTQQESQVASGSGVAQENCKALLEPQARVGLGSIASMFRPSRTDASIECGDSTVWSCKSRRSPSRAESLRRTRAHVANDGSWNARSQCCELFGAECERTSHDTDEGTNYGGTERRSSRTNTGRWRAEFEAERLLNIESLNLRWMDGMPRGAGYDFIIDEFMSWGSRSNSPHATVLEDFCQRMHPCDLNMAIKRAADTRKTALLIEGALLGSRWCSRPNPGPLSAGQLYHLLSKPRFRETTNSSADKPNSRTGVETRGSNKVPGFASEETPEPDAEQRIIIITDLRPDFVLALIATASAGDVGSLRNALCRHLASDPYAGLNPAINGLLKFELAFHLPFKALRTFHTGVTTGRSWLDVSFLDWDGCSPERLVSGTYSCGISGEDRRHWVAYCFDDTAHDLHREDGEVLEGSFDGIGGLNPDECYDDTVPFERCEPDPRVYFLRIFATRLSLILDEWKKVVMKIQRSAEVYKKKYGGISTSPHYNFTEASQWTRQARVLASTLAVELSETAAVCRRFLEIHASDFEFESDQRRQLVFFKIQDDVGGLNILHHKMQGLIVLCREYAENLEVNMAHQQQRIANQNLDQISIILMMCSPILLTTGIFSMEEDVRRRTFPMISVSITSFLVVNTFFAALIFIAAFRRRLIILPSKWLSRKMVPPDIQNLLRRRNRAWIAGRV